MRPWLICAHHGPGSKGSVCCALKPEVGWAVQMFLEATAAGFAVTGSAWLPWAAQESRISHQGWQEGLSLGQPGQRGDDAHETWLEDVFKSSSGFNSGLKLLPSGLSLQLPASLQRRGLHLLELSLQPLCFDTARPFPLVPSHQVPCLKQLQ